ncbi:MBL fold metallo-hydrolase [Candidatus Bipolaricaulota bacterium]|nr:MBL fold metallo-hydrolase [Candidatus Bipolaricaulota bacterium]
MQKATSSWVTTDLCPSWDRLSSRPSWEQIAPDVLMLAGTANTYVLRTGNGLILVDPGHEKHQAEYLKVIRQWSPDPVILVAYTHGHSDHVSNFKVFLDAGESPEVVAQENCLARFERYEEMHGFNEHINRKQFAAPELSFPAGFLRPTKTFREFLHHDIGGERVEFRAAQGETDDHALIWFPGRGMLFVGDLATWKIPNSGNPLKVQRYPVAWLRALEQMLSLDAEWLCPGHDLVLHGREPIRTMLQAHVAYLGSLIEQVRARMNRGESCDHILHCVKPDPALACLPYLRSVYNHSQFIVGDLLRNWGGWWDGVGSHLLPAPDGDQAREIAQLAGGSDHLVRRARELAAQGRYDLACHVIDWAVGADPKSRIAQEGKRDIYRLRTERETALMARGFFLTEVLDAEQALVEIRGEDES